MKITAVASLIALTQIVGACQSSSSGPMGDEIVIASDLPSTAFATGIVPIQQAIYLAIRQRGQLGRFKLVYLPFDDTSGGIPSQAMGVQNVKRMIGDSRVLGMIGPHTSNTVYAEIQVANAHNLVMLSPSNTNICVTLAAPHCRPQPTVLRTKGPSNYFRIAPPESAQGRAMARYAAGTLKVQRVAAFDEWPDEGPLIIESFKDEFAREGGTLVLQRKVAAGTPPDFTQFLADARANGAQAIYGISHSGGDHSCAAAVQARSAFPGGVYFLATDTVVTDTGCIEDAVSNANGIVATVPNVDVTQSSDPEVTAVVQAYRKAYPKTSDIGFNTYVFAAYDCARLLLDAISRALQQTGGALPTRLQVLTALAQTQGLKGVTGTYSFDSNGDATSPMMTIYQVQDGHWKYVEQVDAGASSS